VFRRSSHLWRVVLVVAMAAALVVVAAGTLRAEPPRIVILMVGDGMGPEQMKAASLFVAGKEGALFLESLPQKAEVVTCPAYLVPPPGVQWPVETKPSADAKASADTKSGAGAKESSAKAKPKTVSKITDSAAAATAMAAGQKVYNGVLSVALPGDGKPLGTVLEQAAAQGKGTGIVTSSYLTDATPAAFASHARLRSLQKEIAAGMLHTRPNVMLGGGPKPAAPPSVKPAGTQAATDKEVLVEVKPAVSAPKVPIMTADEGKAAGFQVVTDRVSLEAVQAAAGGHVLGLFGLGPMCYEQLYLTKAKKDYDNLPHLSEMAMAALRLLSAEPKGFFLLIEGGCIDKACHVNKLAEAVQETIEFDKTVRQVAEWAAKRTDTLLLVTADHETGGLKVTAANGQGQLPDVKWAGKVHTGVNVRLFAQGPGSDAVKGTLDNTDLFRILTGTFTSPTVYRPAVSATPAPAPPVAETEKDD
jgi:alkaline phosphatase